MFKQSMELAQMTNPPPLLYLWLLVVMMAVLTEAGALPDAKLTAQEPAAQEQLTAQEANQSNQRIGQRQDQRAERREERRQSSDQAERRRSENRTADSDSKDTTVDDEHAEDEAPALGVIVGSCPGDAVCVIDTVWGSPAHEAGLGPGDFILSIDGKKITSPAHLRRVLQGMQPGKEVTVKIWNAGQESTKRLTLAARGEEQPPSHKAWLGVMLAPAREDGEDQGVVIDRVMRRSPAERAGLRSGDVIIKQNGKNVTSVKEFIESVEDKGPNSEMQLTVKRKGKEQRITARLGHLDEAPLRFLREAMRPPMADWRFRGMPFGDDGSWRMMGPSSMIDETLEETLDEMRRRIRDLEQQVRELDQSQDRPSNSDQPRSGGNLRDDDLTGIEAAVGGSALTLVMQRVPYRSDRYRDPRRFDNNFLDWRNRYRSDWRTPLYRSPRYGNSYYRYGGRPYYGPGYGYGAGWGRRGVQLGNFGVYWY